MNGANRRRPSAIVSELIRLGIVSVADAVDRGLEMEERSMSHEAYRVLIGGEPRFFVKRVDPVNSIGRQLDVEAAVYRLADEDAELSSVMPACFFISDGDSLIVLEALSTDPLPNQANYGSQYESLMGAYGRAVAKIHAVYPEPFGESPWLLTDLGIQWATEPEGQDPMARFFGRVARREPFVSGFRAARESWRAESLIHGDLRWSNVMADDAEHPAGIRLVDWELACLGDPAWDVGSVLADVLLTTTLVTGRRASISELVNGFAPFVSAYLESASDEARRAAIRRGTRLAGVRLIQTISEYGHTSVEEMAAVEPLLLPWAADLLENPEDLNDELLGAVRP